MAFKSNTTKTKNTHWQQTLCGVEDAEKVEHGVVDISWAQEGQAPGGPHQAGKTQHSEATPAGRSELLWVPPSVSLSSCSRLGVAPVHLFHFTYARGHCHQYARVEYEYNGEIHQVQRVEERVICDPAAVGQAGNRKTVRILFPNTTKNTDTLSIQLIYGRDNFSMNSNLHCRW